MISGTFLHDLVFRCEYYTNLNLNAEHTMEFTYETETNSALYFLDIILNHTDNDLKLRVYQKSTNAKDLKFLFSPSQQNIILDSNQILFKGTENLQPSIFRWQRKVH